MAEIGGMNIRALAAKYGTPLYVYDEGRICDILNSYREHFKSDIFETGVLYASKAFSCKAIVKLIEEYGMYLDVVSGGEIYTAKQAGYDMSKIFFHGNNKTPEEITYALSEHVGTFVVDNVQEAELLKELSENADYTVHALLRVNPGVEAHTHNYIVTAHVDSKFGISFLNEESTQRLIALLKKILCRLLREICPREYGGEVRFGFEDPFTTGQVCSAFALLYPVYRDRIRVVPWFDREELFADLSVKGRIRLFTAAFAAAQVWFSRDFQKVFKRFRNRNKMMEVSHG